MVYPVFLFVRYAYIFLLILYSNFIFLNSLLPFRKERNLIEAASNGAQQSIKLVANIGVNLIAFIALLQFINATLTWFGQRAGLEPPEYEYLTFQV